MRFAWGPWVFVIQRPKRDLHNSSDNAIQIVSEMPTFVTRRQYANSLLKCHQNAVPNERKEYIACGIGC